MAELPGRKATRVADYLPDADVATQEHWDQYLDWLWTDRPDSATHSGHRWCDKYLIASAFILYVVLPDAAEDCDRRGNGGGVSNRAC